MIFFKEKTETKLIQFTFHVLQAKLETTNENNINICREIEPKQ